MVILVVVGYNIVVVYFFIAEMRDSNLFNCKCPVDTCINQFKNWLTL